MLESRETQLKKSVHEISCKLQGDKSMTMTHGMLKLSKTDDRFDKNHDQMIKTMMCPLGYLIFYA